MKIIEINIFLPLPFQTNIIFKVKVVKSRNFGMSFRYKSLFVCLFQTGPHKFKYRVSIKSFSLITNIYYKKITARGILTYIFFKM